ncbi:MAG: methylenetetrahydrofolate--tRNA-(uracil(54)-C(5))-methyltransferase (FADH(2)-oxidizing) TrmFO [Kiritimatiellia bacterium]|nr:methylenetetrahydrofolate--tRNA-(uracil(54)-C(5))-methyltransferase (FADH(2)-oxidizing) TrmFO [Kiritimatiellia bacterium]
MTQAQSIKADLRVVGGGLAGCEAAWQAAERGLSVLLYEMRPGQSTPAHRGGDLAELVCSNSLGSKLPDRATGLLQEECRRMGSLLLRCAEETAVPAGGALAVDRDPFSRKVTDALSTHPRIRIERSEVVRIPEGLTVLATGPLTSPAFSNALAEWVGAEHLFFYDAMAPIVDAESIDRTIAFDGSRYDRGETGEGDYLNCPFTREAYERFAEELRLAQRVELRSFERDIDQGVRTAQQTYFEGCLPVETLAARGARTLAFGPLRPVGLRDPLTGRRPYAVVQLRRENLAATLFNLVGFQTNLTISEQDRVFRMIPGLAQARFVRYGQMHRNTYLRSPGRILPSLQWIGREDLFLAGQMIGVEGYMGSVATGLLAGVNAARRFHGESSVICPAETMIGALCRYVAATDAATFQPMKANFGILPPPEDGTLRGREKAAWLAARAADRLPIELLR